MPVLLPLLLASVSTCVPANGTAPSETLEEMYRAGVTFETFLANATGRRELWQRNWQRGTVPEPLAERARATGSWRLLVIAEDRCSDSVNTIPYIARLAELAPNIELRVIDSKRGRPVMEAHRTPDGRPATPTVILLDAEFREAGCWIERPTELQTWWIENERTLDDDERFRRKMAWYDEDAGASTLREVVEMLERARSGATACAAG